MNSRTTARAALLTLLATTPVWAGSPTTPPIYGLSQTGETTTETTDADGNVTNIITPAGYTYYKDPAGGDTYTAMVRCFILIRASSLWRV